MPLISCPADIKINTLPQNRFYKISCDPQHRDGNCLIFLDLLHLSSFHKIGDRDNLYREAASESYVNSKISFVKRHFNVFIAVCQHTFININMCMFIMHMYSTYKK